MSFLQGIKLPPGFAALSPEGERVIHSAVQQAMNEATWAEDSSAEYDLFGNPEAIEADRQQRNLMKRLDQIETRARDQDAKITAQNSKINELEKLEPRVDQLEKDKTELRDELDLEQELNADLFKFKQEATRMFEGMSKPFRQAYFSRLTFQRTWAHHST